MSHYQVDQFSKVITNLLVGVPPQRDWLVQQCDSIPTKLPGITIVALHHRLKLREGGLERSAAKKKILRDFLHVL